MRARHDIPTTRALVLPAVRDLMRRARQARADLPATAPERSFYLGVEAAASEVVWTELSVSRAPDWLRHESPEFQDGYLIMSTTIADALSMDVPPPRIRLPEPAPRS